jgi:hypothetical protein
VVDAISNTPGFGFSFGAGDIFVSLSGVTYRSGENITSDASTSSSTVPEPSTSVLMLLGFAGYCQRQKLAGAASV